MWTCGDSLRGGGVGAVRKAVVSWASVLGAAALLVAAPAIVAPLGATPWGLALDAASTSLFLCLVAIAVAVRGSEPLLERLGLRSGRLQTARAAIAVAGLIGLSEALEGAMHLTGLAGAGALARIDATVRGARGADLALLLAGAAFCAGAGEELFARGWILRGVARRFGGLTGVVVSSLVFGVLHGDAVHAAAALVLGLYLGILAVATGSIRAGIAAHVLNNVLAIAGTALGLDGVAADAAAAVTLGGAMLAAAGLTALRAPRLPPAAPAAVARAPEP